MCLPSRAGYKIGSEWLEPTVIATKQTDDLLYVARYHRPLLCVLGLSRPFYHYFTKFTSHLPSTVMK
jgi:hypothetical protein